MNHSHRALVTALILTGILVLAALFAPLLAPNDPNLTSLMDALKGPSAQFPLGTDQLGRCMLSRLLYGARTSVFASLVVTIVSFFVGVVAGGVAGYIGGPVDMVLSQIITIFQAFPKLILAIAVAAVLGIGIENTVFALSLVGWVEYARLARTLASGLRGQTFLQAAWLCGESRGRIFIFRVVPNLLPPLIVQASLGVGTVILEITALSYLGMGSEEAVAEWGSMISQGRTMLQTEPQLVLLPAIAIFLASAAFKLLGERLQKEWNKG